MTALARHLASGGSQGVLFGQTGVTPDVDRGEVGDTWLCLMPTGTGGSLVATAYSKVSPSDWGSPITAPAGAPGQAGPAGSLAPWVSGATYAADTSTVLVRASVWQAVTAHTAGSTFEADAVAGKWRPVGQGPVETFNPYLATSPQPQAVGTAPGTPKATYERCDGGGVVNTLIINCVTAAGNVGVGVQRGLPALNGTTPSATRAFYAGPVTAAVGLMSFATGGIVVYPGDFLFLFSDNSDATFWSATTTGSGGIGGLFAGTSYFAQSNPPPVDASALPAAPYRGPLIVGRP